MVVIEQQKQAEPPAAAPVCATCGGSGHITSYFVVVPRKENQAPIERAISRDEFDRRTEAYLRLSPSFRVLIPIKRIRACSNCRPAVNWERKNYGN